MTLSEKINALFQKYDTKLKAQEVEETEEVVLEEIKETEETTEEVNLVEATLKDGTVIYADAEEWAEGVGVYILNDEGEKIPVPTGEYELEDGRMVAVEDGVLVSVSTEEVVEEEMQEEAPAYLTSEQALEVIEKAIGAVREEFSAHLEAKDKEIEKLKTEFQHKGLPKAPKQVTGVKREEIAKLSPNERVAALFNKYKN